MQFAICSFADLRPPLLSSQKSPIFLLEKPTRREGAMKQQNRDALIRRKKADLRGRFRALRAGLSDAEYAARSAKVVAQAQTLPELQQAETVHAYWPMLRSREVDIRPLIAWLQASGKQIVLPVVDSFTGAPRLRHVRFETPEALRPNRWGIHEPTGAKSVPLETIDAVVVPALGAGRNGHRLGYGKGYYDAFLGALNAATICPIFAACLIDRAPAEEHDAPLDIVITEDEIIRPLHGVPSTT